jgi:hypothetical protein
MSADMVEATTFASARHDAFVDILPPYLVGRRRFKERIRAGQGAMEAGKIRR